MYHQTTTKKNLEIMLTTMDYVKASRKGGRDAELENTTGWNARHKVHKSMKNYNRKEMKRNLKNMGY